MPSYLITDLNPQTKFCEIQAIFDVKNKSVLELAIPRWRPARYSLQNYVELIQAVEFFDENNHLLSYTKLNIDNWIIQTKDSIQVKTKYRFYANQFEAGGSFIDQDFILLNPINCLMYDKNDLDQECSLEILSDKDWIVSGLTNKILKQVQDDRSVVHDLTKHTFKDYHHLVDTPLLLVKKDSTKFKKLNFEVKDLENGKIDIEVVIYGENKLDPAKIETDFKAFISEQVKVFKTFAVKNYTFLCILPDFPAYHGVEHQYSSVNIFGPGFSVHKSEDYKQFLGLCCHEFFHHWNIKSMRPKELNQYDYSKEQLFTTGYVAEGFTTLYGDLMLYRADLITLDDFAKILSRTATAHIQNFGRFNASMHESSLDLWIDGYKAGIPNDKVNIYTEGCLLALILDDRIRQGSGNNTEVDHMPFRGDREILAESVVEILRFAQDDRKEVLIEKKETSSNEVGVSLDTLLYKMHEEFGNQKTGYTEQDLIQILNEITKSDFTPFFHQFYNSKVDLIQALSQSLEYLGLNLEIKDSSKSYEANFGFKINPNGEKLEVVKIYPNSVSYQKLCLLDQILAINQKVLTTQNYENWFEYYDGQNIELLLYRKGDLINIELESDQKNGIKIVEIKPN